MSVSNAGLNRAAIVTGAAQGLGRAIALRLAQDGYDIALNDLPDQYEALHAVAGEVRQRGRDVIVVVGDVTVEQDVQMLVDRTVSELGILYVMVANAGIGSPAADVVDMSLELWNRYLSVNMTGVFLCYRAAARQMLKQKRGGRIIGAGSMLGKRGNSFYSALTATKFGVRGLTQALASELAKKGITVNSYAPSYIESPLVEETDMAYSTMTGQPIGTLAEGLKETLPMNRLGTPENVAGLVSYIVSDEADFMTGQSISLNGGGFYD